MKFRHCSVAMRLGCDGIFNNHLDANLLQRILVNELDAVVTKHAETFFTEPLDMLFTECLLH